MRANAQKAPCLLRFRWIYKDAAVKGNLIAVLIAATVLEPLLAVDEGDPALLRTEPAGVPIGLSRHVRPGAMLRAQR